MKTSVPKIHTLTPKFSYDGARGHLRESVTNLLNQREDPIVGYAIVAIHKPRDDKPLNYGYTATWHCTDTPIHHSDIGDIMRNKINHQISKALANGELI